MEQKSKIAAGPFSWWLTATVPDNDKIASNTSAERRKMIGKRVLIHHEFLKTNKRYSCVSVPVSTLGGGKPVVFTLNDLDIAPQTIEIVNNIVGFDVNNPPLQENKRKEAHW